MDSVNSSRTAFRASLYGHARFGDEQAAVNKPRLLISIGAEGGSIAVYTDSDEPPRYKVIIAGQTPTFLDGDDGGGPAIKRDSGWLTSWAQAVEWLGRYPWPNLQALHVDASVADRVWAAIEDYVARSDRPVRDSSLSRWQRACHRKAAQDQDAS